VTDVAYALGSVLAGIGLRALVKTSGKTGLHVIVPIRRTLRYDAAREMARFIGERLMRAHPRDFRLPTVLPRVRKRGDSWAGWLDSAQSVEQALTRDIDTRERADREQRR